MIRKTNIMPKSAWRYATMMIILLGVVAWASFSIISHMNEHLSDVRYATTIRELGIAIWSLTMGVMFLTGAFGMWTIRSAAEIEGRKRIGRFVTAMDYLSDGVLILNKGGRIAGYNPAFAKLATSLPYSALLEDALLTDVFPSLEGKDLSLLMEATATHEIERDCVYANSIRTLRFRSQPASGVRLVLVSDITDKRSQEMHLRQIALLQLIGRIAGGVAHDFNNILCAISGHSALMTRDKHTTPAMQAALDMIQKETQKGASLSRQLLALSRAGVAGRNITRVEKRLDEAASLLRVALTPAWTVKTDVRGEFPPAPLTSGQVEQIILNLGLMAADAQARPGVLTIALLPPGSGNLTHVPDGYGMVLLISVEMDVDAAALLPEAKITAASNVLAGESGVILSVVQSIVEEARGKLEQFSAPSGACIYRVCLPHLDTSLLPMDDDEYPAAIGDYLTGWQVILARPPHSNHQALENALREAGVVISLHDNVISLLSASEDLQKQDAIVIDEQLLGTEREGLLKTLLKLSPKLGILVLCTAPEAMKEELKSTINFAPYTEPPGRLMQALVIAKALRTTTTTHPK